MPAVVEFSEVKDFFVDKWAPYIVDLHSCGGGILSTFFSGVCKALEGLEVYEVLHGFIHLVVFKSLHALIYSINKIIYRFCACCAHM